MGFEPFAFPKRDRPISQAEPTNREDRVASLAKLLHERGITSSMADARRLAEGMVEGERKVMKQAPKAEASPAPAAKPATPDITTTQQARQQPSKLPEEFAKFVAQAATISHESQQRPEPIPIPVSQPMRTGSGQEIASVPHIAPRKQVMFEDAPDLTKMRGYNGPKPQKVEFETQRPKPAAADASQTERPATALRMSTGDAGVKVTRVEETPKMQVVEEVMVIEDEPAPPKQPAPQAIAPAAQASQPEQRAAPESFEQLVAEEFKDAPEKTVELPKSDKPREQRDLAKEHGVDLFSMFKKK